VSQGGFGTRLQPPRREWREFTAFTAPILNPSIDWPKDGRINGTMSLLTPEEVDDILRYPNGKSQRLARRDLIPHVKLPDGSIRFRKIEIENIVGDEIVDATIDGCRDGLGRPVQPHLPRHGQGLSLCSAWDNASSGYPLGESNSKRVSVEKLKSAENALRNALWCQNRKRRGNRGVDLRTLRVRDAARIQWTIGILVAAIKAVIVSAFALFTTYLTHIFGWNK
jgi:hypothetical protein